jgi:PAS domain S-box-containing protein
MEAWRSDEPATSPAHDEATHRRALELEQEVARLRAELSGASEDAARYRAILESAADYAIVTLEPEGRITSWNAGAAQLLGWSEAEALGRHTDFFFTPEDRQNGRPEEEIACAIERGRAEDERWHLRKDGSRFWGSGVLLPLRSGPQRGFLKVMRDRTAQRGARAALAASEARLSLALSAAELGIWDLDLVAGTLHLDERCRAIFGQEAAEIPWRQTLDLIHPEERERVAEAFRLAADGDGEFETERRIARPDGALRWVHLKGRVTFDGDGEACRPVRMAGVAMDISERKAAEERQVLLLRELSHRVKNTLALIQSMVRQTGARARSLGGFLEVLGGRLRALAAAHDLLSGNGWSSTSLRDLSRAALAAHEDRVRIEVDDLPLKPAAAQDLVLALHELSTNAAKYGALSGTGAVRLESRVADDHLVLTWRETGGPPVAPPADRGFGSVLLERIVSYQHQGRVEADWRPEGLVCTLRLPLAKIADG